MKTLIINNILTFLKKELAMQLQAANNAHSAATDDQSIAETQYDTLAIEASYLAEGQSRRVEELQQAIRAFLQLSSEQKNNALNYVVTIGSLVQLFQDEESKNWFFIAPAAAGFKTTIAQQNVTVVTPESPMGKALINLSVGDEVNLTLGSHQLNDHIVTLQ